MKKRFERHALVGVASMLLFGCGGQPAQEPAGGPSTGESAAWAITPRGHTTAPSIDSPIGPVRPAPGNTLLAVPTSFHYRSAYAPALPADASSFGLISGVRMYNADAPLPPEALVLRKLSVTAPDNATSSFVGFIVGTVAKGTVFHVKNIDQIALLPPGPDLDVVLYFSFPTTSATQPLTLRYGSTAVGL
jgi:hypothetical protein